jgi:hypothetical protein
MSYFNPKVFFENSAEFSNSRENRLANTLESLARHSENASLARQQNPSEDVRLSPFTYLA